MKRTVLRLGNRLPAFARDDRGSSLVEFAFGLPIMALALVGSVEFGMVMFVSTLVESSLRDAARFGITGAVPDGQTRLERILKIINERTIGLIDMDKAKIEVRVYPTFGDVGRGESFVDGNDNGQYDAGETFTDETGNGVNDSDIGETGEGDAGAIVAYRLEYAWPLLTPLVTHLIGKDGTFTLKSSIAVRNEPYDQAVGAPAPGG